jgi:hypothetical protein
MDSGALLAFGEKVLASMAARTAFRFAERAWPTEDPERFGEDARRFYADFRRWVFPVVLEAVPWLQDRLLPADGGASAWRAPVASLFDAFKPGGLQPTITVAREPDEQRVDDEVIRFLRQTGRIIEDRPVFRLLAIGADGICTLGISSYARALSTCDVHLLNLIRYLPSTQNCLRQRIFARQSFIRRWASLLEQVLVKGQFHALSAAVGCSVLTVMAKGAPGDGVFFVGASSDKKNAAGERHLLPSFMIQPIGSPESHPVEEAQLRIQVMREFAEELLGHAELDESLTAESLRSALQKVDACRDLDAALDDGRAQLSVTGLVFDVMRLRPEFTMLLTVTDPAFYERHNGDFKRNFEFKDAAEVEIKDDAAVRELLQAERAPLCGPAHAALVLGRQTGIDLLAEQARTPRPERAGSHSSGKRGAKRPKGHR